jgi:hypothetical protein
MATASDYYGRTTVTPDVLRKLGRIEAIRLVDHLHNHGGCIGHDGLCYWLRWIEKNM